MYLLLYFSDTYKLYLPNTYQNPRLLYRLSCELLGHNIQARSHLLNVGMGIVQRHPVG